MMPPRRVHSPLKTLLRVHLLSILAVSCVTTNGTASGPAAVEAAVVRFAHQPDFAADLFLFNGRQSVRLGRLTRSHEAFAFDPAPQGKTGDQPGASNPWTANAREVPSRIYQPDHGPAVATSRDGAQSQDIDQSPLDAMLGFWAPEVYGCGCDSAEAEGDTTIAGHPCRRILTHGIAGWPGSLLFAARDLAGLVIRVEQPGTETGYELRDVTLHPPELKGPTAAGGHDEERSLAGLSTSLSLELRSGGEGLMGTVRADRPIDAVVEVFGDPTTIAALEFHGTLRRLGSTSPLRSFSFRRAPPDSADPLPLQARTPRFIGSFVPGEDGEFEVVVEGKATLDRGRTFTRTMSQRLHTAVVHATLAGTYTRVDADTNRDGFVDEVRLSPDVDVEEPGRFEVSATLDGVTHQRVWATKQVDLAVGRSRPTVTFAGKDLHQLGSGRATLEFHLGDPSDDTVEFDRAVLDHAFSMPARLDPPDIVSLGAPRIAPVDRDRNGRYEALVCTFRVRLRRSGHYQWNGRLLERSYTRPRDVAAHADSALDPGIHTLTLSFDGDAIADLGPGHYVIYGFEFKRDGDPSDQGWFDELDAGTIDPAKFGAAAEHR